MNATSELVELLAGAEEVGPAILEDPAAAGELAGAEARNAGVLRNFAEIEFTEVDAAGKSVTRTHRGPRPIAEISGELRAATGGWPRACNGDLFVPGRHGEVRYLERTAEFFAWIQERMLIDWAKGSQSCSREEFLAHLCFVAEPCKSIESLPHWPPLAGAYYSHRPLPKSPGGALAGFLGHFNPATALDAHLLLTAVLTPFWGGPAASRPMFLITAPAEDDPQQGRGVGKSTLVDVIADELCGGSIDVLPTEDIGQVKSRLFSDGGRSLRVLRLDNVKSHRLSWAELEGLLTSTMISGKKLFRGEGRRENMLTWYITLNGASLSKDLAQRVIPVMLARPEFSATWHEELLGYARANRWEILAEIGELLTTPTPSLRAATRWGAWEQGVLSRVDDPGGCQDLILRRQGAIDGDGLVRDLVLDHFRHAVARCFGRTGDGLEGGNQVVLSTADWNRAFIPSRVAADWLSRAMGRRFETDRATAFLKTLGLAEVYYTVLNGTPGFRWRGKDWSGNPKAKIPRLASTGDRMEAT